MSLSIALAFFIFCSLMSLGLPALRPRVASAFDSWSSIKGCYRFFSDDEVESKIILEATH